MARIWWSMSARRAWMKASEASSAWQGRKVALSP
jgi:hypothetical protein